MKSSQDHGPIVEKEPVDKRKSYQAPAIIYEGKISIRAGSPEPPGGFPGGSGFPFADPSGSN